MDASDIRVFVRSEKTIVVEGVIGGESVYPAKFALP